MYDVRSQKGKTMVNNAISIITAESNAPRGREGTERGEVEGRATYEPKNLLRLMESSWPCTTTVPGRPDCHTTRPTSASLSPSMLTRLIVVVVVNDVGLAKLGVSIR